MRRLVDEIAMAADAADDADYADYAAQPGDDWALSMKRVEVEITRAVETMRVLRAAGYTW